MPRRLTVLSVTHRTAGFLQFQAWAACATASGDFDLRWRVIDTSPGETDRPALATWPGIEIAQSDVARRWAPDRVDRRYSPRSWQHAQALHQLIGELDGELGLIVDPDCFVLRRHWDRVLVTALDRARSDLIGAPWHPLRRFKFGAGAPTATFMLFRTASLQRLAIDFTPGVYPPLDSAGWRWPLLRWRHFGTWKDTGWRVAEAVQGGELRSLVFDAPVLQPQPGGPGRRLRYLCPSRMRLYPAHPYRPPSRGLIGSHELAGAPGGERYEEYWWDGQPIACHLRAASQLQISFESPEAQFWVGRVAAHLRLPLDDFEQLRSRQAGAADQHAEPNSETSVRHPAAQP